LCGATCRAQSLALLSVAVLAFMFAFMPAANVAVVVETICSELDNFTLLAIPLFVLMGAAIGNLFVINGIAPDIPLRKIVWGVLPFLALMALAIVLLCLAPEIATWLPNHYLAK